MDQETIEGLLKCIDDAIVKRDKNYSIIDSRYKNENGHVLGSEYDEYEDRKTKIVKRSENELLDYQRKLDELCKRVRSKQPALIELCRDDINCNGRFPRRIALGKYHVEYQNLDFFVPKMFKFPFEKPMYICDKDQIKLLHKVLLRLMYTLPVDKQEYYVFDPMGLGKCVWNFNRLFDNKALFPQNKVMTTAAELKDALKGVMKYTQALYAGTFDLQTNCEDWDSYNRWLYSQKKAKKMLPYKVFLFLDVPDGMDAECFEMFIKLLRHSQRCGFLVLFSFNERLLEAEDGKMREQEILLKQCVQNSVQLHYVLNMDIADISFEKLRISSVGEKFPNDEQLDCMLRAFDEVAKKDSDSMFSFEDMLKSNSLFEKKSNTGITIPCGYTTSGGTEVQLSIGDRTPHYLIGGTTGSGKSNLLHNIIMSACWYYSPEEVRIYLLDFKEGVEFSRYSSPLLRHAELVATEADTEYGVSVLRHLLAEKTKRYKLFKECNCKDIAAYKDKKPTEIMPRVLVVVDEFQMLFESTNKNSTIEILTTLAKQGRACGIHFILATQSLKGIDFGNLAPQFGGRIVLKCSPEDSKLLLGGITSNNEAASELEIPYAILNITQGSKLGNLKYAVPEAKTNSIEAKINEINSQVDRERIVTQTKIFEGQVFPKLPDSAVFEHCGMTLTLGEIMSYDAELLKIEFVNKPENNVLLCGRDEQIKLNFLTEIALSANGSDDCNELIYIGELKSDSEIFGFCKKSVICFSTIAEFVEAIDGMRYGEARLVVLDNLNLNKAIGFPLPSYSTVDERAKKFKSYWEDANKNCTHFVAMYDGFNEFKASGLPLQDFRYRVGYSLNSYEENQMLNNQSTATKNLERRRAFLADNLAITAWFRPFDNR